MSHCHVWLKHVITFAIWFFTSLLTFKLLCFTYSSTYKYVHACNCGSNKTAFIWSVNFIATCYCELWHYFYYPRMVLRSVASVCLSVCSAVTFESLDLESSFLVRSYTFRIFRSRSYIKVTGQGHRSKKRVCVSCLQVVCLQLKTKLVAFCLLLTKSNKLGVVGTSAPHRCLVRTL